MGIEKALRDPLYAGSVAALVCVAVVAGSLMLFSGEGAAESPRAVVNASATNTVALPQATATQVATPSYGDVLADTQRLLELAKVRDALAAYHAQRGSYPSTGGVFETVCEEPVDSGCELREVDSSVPSGFNGEPFWYESDGTRYTLFARVATTPSEDSCPDETPPALDGAYVVCVQEGLP